MTKAKRKRKSLTTEASRIVATRSTVAGASNAAAPPAGGRTATANVPPPPMQCELTSRMEQSVLDVRDKIRPEQSANIYDNKEKEFLQFASHVYPEDPYRNSLNAEKVYRFMFYQTFRGQKKRGGKKESNPDLF
jgi:hypothetical protein